MPPKRMLIILLTALAIGALPLLFVHPGVPASAPVPWYKTPVGWIGLIGLLWTAIAGIGGALISAALAARMRSFAGLLFAVALLAATVYLIRIYFRALF